MTIVTGKRSFLSKVLKLSNSRTFSGMSTGGMTDNFYYCENIKSLYNLIWQILFMAGARDGLMDLRSKDTF